MATNLIDEMRTTALAMSVGVREQATDAETEGAVDEGRATERVVSLISTPEQETWMAKYFVRSRQQRDGWGHRRVKLWFRLRPNEVRQATGRTLEEAIEIAQEMQRADAMITVHGRLIA